MKHEHKKSLGQHFLKSETVLKRILEVTKSLKLDGAKNIVEVGPGDGALTQVLLDAGFKVWSIEIDKDLVKLLKTRFEGYENFTLISGDALKVKAKEIPPEFSLIANLPYNVGTQIFLHFVEEFSEMKSFAIMLQKEVVQRLKADISTKDYGVPSVLAQWQVDFLGCFWVSPGAFDPPPKVDSGVIWGRRKIDPIVAPFLDFKDYKHAKSVVKRAFLNRRQMLRRSFPILKDSSAGSQRAEELTPLSLYELSLKLIDDHD